MACRQPRRRPAPVYGAILEDIKALAAPFDTANAGRNLVLIMNPAQAMALAMAPGPDGTFGWARHSPADSPSSNRTNVTAGKLIMIDAADFVSVTGAPEFEVQRAGDAAHGRHDAAADRTGAQGAGGRNADIQLLGGKIASACACCSIPPGRCAAPAWCSS